MSDNSASVLFIPKWFPGRNDPQNGVFILKHAQTIAPFYPVKIMHLCAAQNQAQRFEFEKEELENIEILNCYYKSFGNKYLQVFSLLVYLLAFYKSYKKLYPKSKPVLTHAHVFTRTVALAYLLKIWKGVPYLVSEHWTIYLKGGTASYSFFHKKTMQFLAKQSEAITAVSEILLQSIKKCGLKSKRMRVIENAVPAPKEITANTDKKIIGLVADFDDENKRISDVIRVFSEISKAHKDWQLHIVGGGKDEEMLHKLAEQTGLNGKQIIFHGRQNNAYVYGFLRDITFLVNFSRHETFSVILIEAILHGKPVISSKSGGPQSFVNKENGVLVERNNLKELKNAMEHMLLNAQNYNAQKIRKSIGDKYNPEVIGRKFRQLYSEILTKDEN